MTWQILSVVPVWVLAIVGAIVIGVTDSVDYLTWLGIVLGAAVIITFAIQLAIRRKEGFVNRTMASLGGVVVLLAAASGIFALLG
jgi:hypothetical protein